MSKVYVLYPESDAARRGPGRDKPVLLTADEFARLDRMPPQSRRFVVDWLTSGDPGLIREGRDKLRRPPWEATEPEAAQAAVN